MDVREKLVELIRCADYHPCRGAVRTIGSMFTTEFIEDIASHLIAHGVTVQEWISVKDRLPEKDGKYQVYIDGHINKGIHHAYFAKDARKVDKFDFLCRWKNVWYGYDNEWGHYEVDAVTHWTPLPQPPKGE